jgi:hypothetical protein
VELKDQIASEVGITSEQVRHVIEIFACETHRTFFEMKNDPYVQILWNTSPMGFFHLLGTLALSAENLGGEFHPEEYILRIGEAEEWQAFSDQMKDWIRPQG